LEPEVQFLPNQNQQQQQQQQQQQSTTQSKNKVISNVIPIQSLEIQRDKDPKSLSLTSHPTTWSSSPVFEDYDVRESCADALLKRKKEVRQAKIDQILGMLEECVGSGNDGNEAVVGMELINKE